MRVYNEHSGLEFKASFESLPVTPTIPGSACWKLLCVTTDTVLQDITEVTPQIEADGSTLGHVFVDIEIPAALNVIQNPRNSRELKRLIVIADKDTPREYNETRDYYIRKTGR